MVDFVNALACYPGSDTADYTATTGDNLSWAPDYGFVTWFVGATGARFKVGGRFNGWFYGVQGTGGDAEDADAQHKNWPPGLGSEFKDGPEVNDYSTFAGVFGTGVYVTGVAGTSVNNVGVYGQAEDDVSVPQFLPAGVVGAANTGPGIVAWSKNWNGVEGWAYQGTAVLGVSEYDRGVHGASTWQPGVQGWSENDLGVMGGSGPEGTQGPTVPNTSNIAAVVGTSDAQHGVIGTSNASVGVIGFSNNIGVLGYTTTPGSFAGYFLGDVLVDGNFSGTGTKAAVVPFPDGTHRALYCMESPELWFEDFGAAELKRGRAVVSVDADFGKVIKRGDYRVFLTPEGDCRGLYVRRKGAASFEVRELQGGKSSVAFSYRIVGRRKDVKGHSRFAKIDTRLPLPAAVPRAQRTPTRAGLHAFAARAEKATRARRPKSTEAKLRAFAARAEKAARARRPKSTEAGLHAFAARVEKEARLRSARPPIRRQRVAKK